MSRALLFLGALTVAAVFAAEGEAFAFCRTTSCECKHGDKALPEKNGLPQSTCGQPDGDCPRDEHGCRKLGVPIAWAGRCTGFSPNLAGTNQLPADDFNAAFDRSFQAWSLVDCGGGRHPSIQVYTLRPTTCAVSENNKTGPNVNAIYFTDNGWVAPSTKELDGVIAKTRANFLKSGEIVDADIAINSARHDFTVTDDPVAVRYDLVSVMTHEVGHFLGLDHSDDPDAVMYWQYSPGTVRRELQRDDIEAICTVYPPDRDAACDPVPKGGLQDTCGPDPELNPGCAVGRDAGRPAGASGGAVAVGLTMLAGALERWKRKRGAR